MAVDEAIMRSCAQEQSPPTLRIYSWKCPSVSLGYMQTVDKSRLDLDYCREEGIEVVRRITGGRAVVHGSDLTFSIALNEHDLPKECHSVLASHRWLMGGIVEGLRSMKIDAEIGSAQGSINPRDTKGADCFAHIAECDVRIGLNKVVGSAQVRKWGAILEQGSIPCEKSIIDLGRLFSRKSRINYDSYLPEWTTYEAIEQALAGGFARFFETVMEPGALTGDEQHLARTLETEKYSVDDWTNRFCGTSSQSCRRDI